MRPVKVGDVSKALSFGRCLVGTCATSEKPVRRLRFLDGLRGWGAVVVLLFHVFSEGLPIDATIGDRLKYFIPFNGMMAVFVFFVVSGFSLSALPGRRRPSPMAEDRGRSISEARHTDFCSVSDRSHRDGFRICR